MTTPSSAPAAMVWIPGGTFLMGPTTLPGGGAGSQGAVEGSGSTGTPSPMRVRPLRPQDWARHRGERAPTRPTTRRRPDMLVPASTVFRQRTTGRPWQPLQLVDLCAGPTGATHRGRAARSGRSPTTRWSRSPGPTWLPMPTGGQGAADEAEWELACRGGLEGAEFAWGDELSPDGRDGHTWQGEFPVENTRDGYRGRRRWARSGQRLRPSRHDRNVWSGRPTGIRPTARLPMPAAASPTRAAERSSEA